MTVVDPDNPPAWLGGQDLQAVRDFGRFLSLGKRAPIPGVPGRLLVDHPGWLPYVAGDFLGVVGQAPPEGFDDVAFTAWTFPA